MEIDASFPGGNIVVEKIDGDEVWLHQDLRDTEGDWFYWYFRVRGAAGRALTFHFTASRALGARGPAMSLDQGRTWAWLGAVPEGTNSFHAILPSDADEVRYSFAMPYLGANWRSFLYDHPTLRGVNLGQTPAGRNVMLYRLPTKGPGTAPARVLITCRHHCCEMMANYVLEGCIDALLAAPVLAPQFAVVPFVDVDGVEDGDQGKNRRPHDHNRDYGDTPIYASCRALQAFVKDWSGATPLVVLDLHCPWIAGHRNETIYVVGSSDPELAEEQLRFTHLLARHTSGPLPVSADDFLPFGVDWNSAANYTQGLTFCRWAGSFLTTRLATTLEFPYAAVHGQTVTPATARRFGQDLAQALLAYLG